MTAFSAKLSVFSLVLCVLSPLAYADIPTVTYGQLTCQNQIPTVFSHGHGANKGQAWYYSVESECPNAPLEGRVESFDYKDVRDPSTGCLGQRADVERLLEVVKKHKDCSLYGVSRGAVTIANSECFDSLDNVGDVVEESPFAQSKDVVKKVTGFASFASALPLVLPNHDPNGMQPIKSVNCGNKKKPRLIVASKQDRLIPVESTIAYYKGLRDAGHENTHLLVVDYGEHANILSGKDGEKMRNVIHAFKAAYDRPHNPAWAAAGAQLFKKCQPSFPSKKPKKSFFSSLSSLSS